jgi:metal-responsive CopG/Arc/MetJ family transcriptional regulator
MTQTKIETHSVKFRMPDELANELTDIAYKRRQNGEQPNVSALIRTILRHELTQQPPPPETYGELGGDGIYTVRMPFDLLDSLEDLADKLEIDHLSSLIRSMLRSWIVSQHVTPGYKGKKHKEHA